MIPKPKPAHTLLPGLLLAASVALPGGTSAQSATPARGPGGLSTAMAEALRSPFHARTGAGGLAILQPSGVPVPHADDRQARDSAQGPSFHWVFWPTLGAAALSDLASAILLYGAAYEGSIALLVAGAAIPVLVPATVARIAGGSFAQATLGSAVGFGLGIGLFFLGQSIGLPDEGAAYGVIPIPHAFVTTVLSRLRPRTP